MTLFESPGLLGCQKEERRRSVQIKIYPSVHTTRTLGEIHPVEALGRRVRDVGIEGYKTFVSLADETVRRIIDGRRKTVVCASRRNCSACRPLPFREPQGKRRAVIPGEDYALAASRACRNRDGCALKHEMRCPALVHLQFIVTAAASLAGIVIYTFILHMLNGRSPVLDSATTVLSVTAMILTVKRCIEQWVIWTIVNILAIVMWLQVYLENGNSAASLLMWCIALANGIIFFITWSRELEPEEREKCQMD